VVQTQKEIDGTNGIIRTHQLEFFVLSQITQMNCAKFTERNEAPDGLRVFGIILSRLELRTIWIQLPGAPGAAS
jgi:hypothetical protein